MAHAADTEPPVHLYDRLSPYLSPPRRVVLFDFLGWGSSDKSNARRALLRHDFRWVGYDYT
jgi:hypothetical protein